MAKTTGRRAWLSMVARGAAAATVGVLGQPRAARSDGDGGHPCIKHIVVLMMENRSFDHMLGLLMNEIPDLRGVRGGDWANVDDKGNVHPLTDGAAYQGQFRVDPPHDFWSVHQQIYAHPGQPATRPLQPDMRGFAATYARAGGNPANVMKCFSPEQLPTIRALAKNYLVCDNWFASVPGPTNPNRAFAHFGTSFGRVDNGPVWFMMVTGRPCSPNVDQLVSSTRISSPTSGSTRRANCEKLLSTAAGVQVISSRRPSRGLTTSVALFCSTAASWRASTVAG